MPARPADLLQLSKDLAALGGSEVWQRCVVSRAYDACLHATDETFPDAGGPKRIDGESSHAHIIGKAVAYGRGLKPGRSSANSIAQMMPKLRRFRNAADYDIDEVLAPREFSDVVARAERLLALCADVERLREKARDESVAADHPAHAFTASPSCASRDGLAPKPSLKRIK